MAQFISRLITPTDLSEHFTNELTYANSQIPKNCTKEGCGNNIMVYMLDSTSAAMIAEAVKANH